MKSLAPVIVFNYNRPDHSLRTWEALSQNQYATETELFLYCDGPKVGASEEMKQRIASLHEQAKQYAIDASERGKFKAVHVVCAEQNKGLANSIIDGVSEVVNRYGSVIVLEDDLLTSPFFLKYMNEALVYYQSYPSVFCVSANRPPTSKMSIPDDYEYDVFVSLMAFSTGWATWAERWKQIDWSIEYFDELNKHPYQIEAFNRGGDVMMPYLTLQHQHKIDSWAIRFNYSMFANHGVAILPCIPYVDNIGFDGSGVHSGTNATDFRNDVSLSVQSPRFLNVLYEDSRIINQFASYYASKRLPLWKRAINKLSRSLLGKTIFLKKRVYA